ncbi:MAG: hypothetical protein IPL29_07435 [Propionivibrio sp.]|nr:hypothetical protein [Propionivibrio sp.]
MNEEHFSMGKTVSTAMPGRARPSKPANGGHIGDPDHEQQRTTSAMVSISRDVQGKPMDNIREPAEFVAPTTICHGEKPESRTGPTSMNPPANGNIIRGKN